VKDVFVSFHYDERTRKLARQVEELLESHGLHAVTGDVLGGGALTAETKAQIAEADALIALLTRRELRPDGRCPGLPETIQDDLAMEAASRPHRQGASRARDRGQGHLGDPEHVPVGVPALERSHRNPVAAGKGGTWAASYRDIVSQADLVVVVISGELGGWPIWSRPA
jgi:hypothetical protein